MANVTSSVVLSTLISRAQIAPALYQTPSRRALLRIFYNLKTKAAQNVRWMCALSNYLAEHLFDLHLDTNMGVENAHAYNTRTERSRFGKITLPA